MVDGRASAQVHINCHMPNQNYKDHIEVVLPYECLLGEGPVWDADNKIISWIDVLNGIKHEFDTKRATHRMIELGVILGSIALTNSGNYLAALKSGLAIVDRITGNKSFLHHPESSISTNRFNDGKCDRAGRFWVGTMSMLEEPGAGNVYMFDEKLTCTKKIESVTISNGLVWSADHKTLYYIDTPTLQVVAYDYDISTGKISNKQVVVNIPQNEGYPDGMTIDKEGMLWIAHWDGSQVARWDPSSGKKIHFINLPVDRVTSCTFGGEHLTDIYITTAKVGLTEKQLSEQPLAGSLFIIRDSEFQGLPSTKFDDTRVIIP